MKLLLTLLIISSIGCNVSKNYPRYKVREVKHIKGNAYQVRTDSFTVVKIVRGGLGKYKPDSVSLKNSYLVTLK